MKEFVDDWRYQAISLKTPRGGILSAIAISHQLSKCSVYRCAEDRIGVICFYLQSAPRAVRIGRNEGSTLSFPSDKIRKPSSGDASVAGSAVAQEDNCTQIDDWSRPDCPGAIVFFHRFQSALQSKDHQTIAAMVNYPVLTSINHKRVRIHNQQQLLAHFDDIFDAGVRCSILNVFRLALPPDISTLWR
jgi:hypothetical protein